MNNLAKAALATTAGAALLLGGAGSLAFWNDTEDAPGATVTSGSLGLGAPDCGAGWTIDGGAAFAPATDLLVPGDTITQTCTFVVDATGGHLTGDISVETPSDGSGALADELTYAAAYTLDGVSLDPTASTEDVTSADDGEVLSATITVTFPYGSLDNDSNNDAEYGNGAVQAVLDAITVTLTQGHSAS